MVGEQDVADGFAEAVLRQGAVCGKIAGEVFFADNGVGAGGFSPAFGEFFFVDETGGGFFRLGVDAEFEFAKAVHNRDEAVEINREVLRIVADGVDLGFGVFFEEGF